MTDYLSSLIREDLDRLSDIVVPGSASSNKLLAGERRKVAVLFLDLSGFTALSERMDHELVHRITNGLMNALGKIVEAHGGYVDKFEGDRIMALFGARTSYENDSIRAVACALRMLEAIGDVNGILSSYSTELSARVGVSFGAVTVAPDASGHLTATGEEVNVASRLEETAQENTIQVTAKVWRECGDLFDWKELGEIAVRGISRPLTTYRPLGPGSVRHERWDRAAGITSSPLIGRRRELLVLRQIWDKQAAGVGRNRRGSAVHLLQCVTGDAGIGKSRLIGEFLSMMRSEGHAFRLLRGSGRSFAQPPYGIWAGLIADFLEIGPTDSADPESLSSRVSSMADGLPAGRASALREATPFLVSLISTAEADPKIADLDEESRRSETLAAIRSFLSAAAAVPGSGRTVVVLDDLQWMDTASLDALLFAVCNADSDRPMLFFCISRTGGSDSALIGGLDGLPPGYARCGKLELSPLDVESCAALAGYVLRPEEASSVSSYLPAEASEFLLNRSAGNPFFLEELIHHLLEQGVLVPSGGGWELSCSLEDVRPPHSIGGLLSSRIDSLPLELRQGMHKAAVIGSSFTEELFVTVSEELGTGEDSAAVLAELARRGFLERTGEEGGAQRRYGFLQELVRESAYDTMLLHNRRVIHACTARALERLYPDLAMSHPEVLADHWESSGNTGMAIEWGMAAMRRLRVEFLNAEALDWADRLGRLLEEEPGDEQKKLEHRLSLLSSRFVLLMHLGRLSDVDPLIERFGQLAEQMDSPYWRARLSCMRTEVLRVRGRTDEAISTGLEGLETAREAGLEQIEARCLSLLGNIYSFSGRLEESHRFYERSLQLARRLGDAREESTQLINIANLSVQRGLLEEAEELFRQGLELKRETGDRTGEARVLGGLGVLAGVRQDFTTAREWFESALRVHVDTGRRNGEGIALGNLAVCNFELGNVAEALELSRRALEIHREVDNRKSQGITLNNIGNFSHQLGRLEEAGEAYEEALAIAVEVRNLGSEASIMGGMALLELDEGDVESAVEHYLRGVGIVERIGLTERFVQRFRDLRDSLLEAGVDESRVPLPSNWSEAGAGDPGTP